MLPAPAWPSPCCLLSCFATQCSLSSLQLKCSADKLRKALAEPVESLFDVADQTTWQSLRNIYKRETEAILPEFLNNLCQFEMEYAPAEEMVSKLKDYAQSVVESKAKEESSKVLIHMKERFTTVFSHDKDSNPRVWTGKEDVRAIAKEARSAALKLLSVMAAIRWDDEPDRIESILTSTLLEGSVISKIASAASADPLASTTWEEVTLCWNPIYLFLLFVGYLMVKALAMQLDVSREFQNGVVPGIISVSVKLLPTIQNLLSKLSYFV
ncbi:Protein ROOT HAIR DEFECTIVE 3 homolog 2 [Zea mays]|uniref:Protein ROOT HAIR DEFECTIVE 3 homolog 2 n=1 Tax=Zea mays TaxID=4577 RepID=A0A1D6P121_MAIZE|nr:Protein ROOT HAIR DEFECTIVE 3 homolog 2 [Zea mays]